MFTALVVTEDYQKVYAVYDAVKMKYPDPVEIQAACSTQECLLRLENNKIDMIILDIEMPGLDTNTIVQWMQDTKSNSFLMALQDFNRFDPRAFDDAFPAADHFRRPYSELERLLTLREAVHICETKAIAVEELAENSTEALRMRLVRERVARYVQDHYSEALSTQDVARAMNYSDAHFCRLFKECFRMSFVAYLNEYRVERAKEMLISCNASVKDIGIRCRYNNPCYFSRVFKRSTGMTPAEYRVCSGKRLSK